MLVGKVAREERAGLVERRRDRLRGHRPRLGDVQADGGAAALVLQPAQLVDAAARVQRQPALHDRPALAVHPPVDREVAAQVREGHPRHGIGDAVVAVVPRDDVDQGQVRVHVEMPPGGAPFARQLRTGRQPAVAPEIGADQGDRAVEQPAQLRSPQWRVGVGPARHDLGGVVRPHREPVEDRGRVGLGRQRSRRPVAGEPVHAVDLLDGYPEPGGGVVQIHADDPTGWWEAPDRSSNSEVRRGTRRWRRTIVRRPAGRRRRPGSRPVRRAGG